MEMWSCYQDKWLYSWYSFYQGNSQTTTLSEGLVEMVCIDTLSLSCEHRYVIILGGFGRFWCGEDVRRYVLLVLVWESLSNIQLGGEPGSLIHARGLKTIVSHGGRSRHESIIVGPPLSWWLHCYSRLSLFLLITGSNTFQILFNMICSFPCWLSSYLPNFRIGPGTLYPRLMIGFFNFCRLTILHFVHFKSCASIS